MMMMMTTKMMMMTNMKTHENRHVVVDAYSPIKVR